MGSWPSVPGRKLVEIVVFDLDHHRFGLPTAQVKEIIRAVAPTPLPQAPPIVEGVINLRGELVPMLNLRQRFQHPTKPIEVSDHLVLAWTRDRLVCLRVDRVTDVMTVDASAIEPLPPIVPRTPYLSGVAKLPDGLVLIHDLTTFLAEGEAEEISKSLEALESREEL